MAGVIGITWELVLVASERRIVWDEHDINDTILSSVRAAYYSTMRYPFVLLRPHPSHHSVVHQLQVENASVSNPPTPQ